MYSHNHDIVPPALSIVVDLSPHSLASLGRTGLKTTTPLRGSADDTNLKVK